MLEAYIPFDSKFDAVCNIIKKIIKYNILYTI